MRTNRLLTVVLAGSLVVAACGGAQDTATTTDSTPATVTTVPLGAVPSGYVGYLHQPTACGAGQPDPATDMKFDAPGDVGLTGRTILILNTSCGSIEIQLDPEAAPEATNSFVFLAESGFFDGTVSHRVIPGFMMQAGDPTATGLGGPGYTLPDEFPAEGTTYVRGIVAMANAGPGTTGSQFFIMLGDADWLGPQYTIVGHVISGLETLDRIAEVPLGRGGNSADPSQSTPLESIYIESVSIQR
ncbi:MAG: peptidylprolyl isomerase [Acidimicrobiia bacterium]